MNFNVRPKIKKTQSPREQNERQKTIDLTTKIKSIWEFVRDQIGLAQIRMEYFADVIRKPVLRYQSDDKVWLSVKNIKT